MNKIDISDFITSIENTFMDNGMMFEVECVTPEEVEDDEDSLVLSLLGSLVSLLNEVRLLILLLDELL